MIRSTSAARACLFTPAGARVLLVCVGVILLVTETLGAQYVQYTAPGTLAQPRVPPQERFEGAIEDAWWNVRGLRLTPWFGLSNLGYVDNVFATAHDTKSDFTLTVGAGLRGYLPTGEKSTLAFHVLPEYVWWQDLVDFRSLNGRYGAGWFGYFDRLSVELDATSSQQQTYVSSELERPADILNRRNEASLEWSFAQRFSVFVSGELQAWRYEDPASSVGTEILSQLERDELIGRSGLRYDVSSALRLGVGFELSDVDFLDPSADRSNRDQAPLVEVVFDHPIFYTELIAAFRATEAKSGSRFIPYNGTTGRFLLWMNHGAPVSAQIYGRNNLVYTVAEIGPYYEDRRVGGAFLFPIGWRFQATAFIEGGANEFTLYDVQAQAVVDDLRAYGGALTIYVGEKSAVNIRVSQTDYSSAHPGRDRSIFRLQIGLTLNSMNSAWW